MKPYEMGISREYGDFLPKGKCKKASLFGEAFAFMVLIPRVELGTSSLPRMRSTN